MSEKTTKQVDQQLIDVIFSITIMICEHPWFKEKGRTRDEVQNWVAKQLADWKIYTAPVGISWGSLCTEEFYKENSPNIKEKD